MTPLTGHKCLNCTNSADAAWSVPRICPGDSSGYRRKFRTTLGPWLASSSATPGAAHADKTSARSSPRSAPPGSRQTASTTDAGYTGRNTDRPGLKLALAVVREGDTLVVTKLDRLGRSILDLHRIANELTDKGVRLSWSGTVYNPLDPAGKLFFSMLAAFAEFESDLIRARTIEGMAEARKAGRIAGKKPKLTPLQQKRLYNDYESGQYTTAQLMELYPLKRSALYATIERERGRRELAQESLSKAG